ncbi:acetyltransferase [Mariannaea sp. PMI_226]|nr:acetyltransferase [Mariannaea sp. PMI_226]
MSANTFNIREICQNPQDGEFLLAAFDGALPHLASIGSGDQWGSQPFSERTEYRDRINAWVPMSEACRLGIEGSEPLRLYIAEVQVGDDNVNLGGLSVRTDEQDRRFLSVAAAAIREHWWPDYLNKMEKMKPIIEKADADRNAFYLEVLISDFRTGSARKGAGAALMKKIKEYSISRGAKVLFMDCWAGNGGNLVKFYTSQGFTLVSDFLDERHDKSDWPGKLLRMDLA